MNLVGFPLTPSQLASAQWWFVLEQQLTAPRFGFDSGAFVPPAERDSWFDATWETFGIEPGQYIGLTVGEIATATFGGRRFGATADQIASSLLQRPIRVALHKDRLLLKPGGDT